MAIKTGPVRFYNAEQGYGFIQLANGADIFFHITDLENDGNDPRQGDGVSFVQSASRNGKPRAINVKLTANVS